VKVNHLTKRNFHFSAIQRAIDDLYSTLGVNQNASQDEIKKVYYKFAKMYHPDLPENKGKVDIQKKFQDISAAYDILGDEKKRKKYDNFGHQGENIDEEEVFGKFSQAMEDMMGKNEDFHRGNNIDMPLTLTFEEAVLGTEKKLEYLVRVQCEECEGLATQPGHHPVLCQICNGKGFTSSGKGVFHQRRICGTCSGNGTIISHPCRSCKGRGTVPKTRKLKVKIPPGVDNEHQVKLTDKGNEGDRRSGMKGSLFINISVKEHPVFKRDKKDIHVDALLTVSQAILGDTIKVQTLSGLVEMKVPNGVQPGEKRILRGKGIKDEESLRPGNQYVHFQVVIPKVITKEQSELIKQFGRTERIRPHVLPKWRSILNSVTSYFWKRQ